MKRKPVYIFTGDELINAYWFGVTIGIIGGFLIGLGICL